MGVGLGGGGFLECGAEGVECGGEAGDLVLEALGALPVVVGLFSGLAVVLEDFCVECSFLFGLVFLGPLGVFGCCVAHVWGFMCVGFVQGL